MEAEDRRVGTLATLTALSFTRMEPAQATEGPAPEPVSVGVESTFPEFNIPGITVKSRDNCGTNRLHAAGVYWGPNDSRNVSEPLEGRPTNNRAEIKAAERAIWQAKDHGYDSVEVRTDSEFLVKSATRWVSLRFQVSLLARTIASEGKRGFFSKRSSPPRSLIGSSDLLQVPNWERNNWTTASGEPVRNRSDFQDLQEASRGIDVRYRHVPGHSGVRGNEEADNLATSGMRQNYY